MSSSSILLLLLVGCTSGTSAVGSGADTSFTVGDLEFHHVWHTKQAMPGKRSDMSATTIGDAIYLVGGCALDQVWVHDPPYSEYRCGGGLAGGVTGRTTRYYPNTNTFDTTLPDAPRARYRHAAAAVDEKIYLLGGTDASGSIVPEVDVFSSVTGLWTTLTLPMPNPTTDLSAFVHAGKIYTVGGYDPSWEASNVTQIFNPATNDVDLIWTFGPQLIQGRGDAFAAVVDNKAYVVGGFHHHNNFQSPISTVEMLDVSYGANPWVARSGMSVARGDKAVAVLNSILHVVGGETKNAQGQSVPLVDVEAYDPIGNAWHFGGDIPSHRFRFVAAAHGDSIFIFGGQGYLEGTHGADDSRYPVMDVVEEYSETVVSITSEATSLLGPSSSRLFGFICAMLATMFFTTPALIVQ